MVLFNPENFIFNKKNKEISFNYFVCYNQKKVKPRINILKFPIIGALVLILILLSLFNFFSIYNTTKPSSETLIVTDYNNLNISYSSRALDTYDATPYMKLIEDRKEKGQSTVPIYLGVMAGKFAEYGLLILIILSIFCLIGNWVIQDDWTKNKSVYLKKIKSLSKIVK
jgi:hypothetical protein